MKFGYGERRGLGFTFVRPSRLRLNPHILLEAVATTNLFDLILGTVSAHAERGHAEERAG